MRWNKCLCLSGDWGEHTFLREALAVGAATVFGLIETRTTNLAVRVSSAPVLIDAFHGVPCVAGSIYMLLRFVDEVRVARGDTAFAEVAGSLVGRTFAAGQEARDIDRDAAAVKSASLDLDLAVMISAGSVERRSC